MSRPRDIVNRYKIGDRVRDFDDPGLGTIIAVQGQTVRVRWDSTTRRDGSPRPAELDTLFDYVRRAPVPRAAVAVTQKADAMIHGSKQLGIDLQQWHNGMDTTYAVGSHFYAGLPVRQDVAENALEGLERLYRHRKASQMPAKDARHLASVIRRLALSIAAATRSNPTKTGQMTTKEADAAIPKAQIRHFVGGFHVGTPSIEIEDAVRAMAMKKAWPLTAVRAGVRYAAKCHAENIALYNAVQSGRF